MSDSVRPHRRQPTRLPRSWDSPGKNTGVGCHFFLQRIFPTQGSNPCLLHWQEDSLPLCHLRSPEYALLLLQLSHVSRVRLCDPIDGSPPGSPVPGILPGKNTGVGCHSLLQCMKVKSESEVAQLYPTLSDPMDCNLPGSSAHGIFQARVLEWVPLLSPPQSLSQD